MNDMFNDKFDVISYNSSFGIFPVTVDRVLLKIDWNFHSADTHNVGSSIF